MKRGAEQGGVAIARFIATRYVSVGKRSHLVSFMSAIAVGGLALGVAILITVLSVMNGFDREMRESILAIVPHITVSTGENLSAARWADVEATIDGAPGVASTAGVIQMSGIAASDSASRAVLINGIDLSEATPAASPHGALQRFLRSGSLEALAQTPWGVLVGQSLAERLGVGVGDGIDLFSTSISLNPITPLPRFRGFEIVGVFRVGTQELDDQLLLVNSTAAQTLFRLRSPYNSLQLRSDDVLQANAIAEDLAPQLPAGMELSTWSGQFGAIYENIRFSRSIIAFMLWLLVGVAAFNLVVSLIMIVRDKRGDIAILRTLGASPETIQRIFLWQGSLIALMGIGIGVVLGIVGALQISDFALFLERRLGLQLLSAEVYPIDFLPSQLLLSDVLLVILGVMFLSALATLYPARRAAAVQPAEALRGD